MFVVPDDILEDLTCDYCYKYLSVGPVTVDKDKKRKCGRCVNNGELTGPISVYQHFLESVTFKCINRFYGCNEIRTHKDVKQHEETCVSKHEFSLSNGENVEIYKYLYQFRKQHGKNFLKKPILKTTPNELQAMNQFIYIKENYVFFIFMEFNVFSKKLSFNAYYMGAGDSANSIQQNYMVEINRKIVHSIKQQPCLPVKKYNIAEWKVNSIQLDEQLLNECEMLLHLDFLIPTIVTKEMLEIPLSHRIIQVPLEFQELYVLTADKKRLSRDTMQHVQIEIELACKVCSNISNENIYITNSGKIRQLICNYCILSIEEDYFCVKSILKNLMINFSQIKFSCIWNCGTFYNVANLTSHEENCQPNNKCPMSDCYFNGLLTHLSEHLLEKHKIQMYSRYLVLKNKSLLDHAHGFYVWVCPKFLIHCKGYINSYGHIELETMFTDESIQHKNKIVIIVEKNQKEEKHTGKVCITSTDLPLKFIFIVVPIV